MPAPPPPARYPPAPAPSSWGSVPRRGRANLNSYFSTDDYPAAALRGHEQGTTGFRLTIGTNGRVSDCAITHSSGSLALDATTCRILSTRARYTPARNAAGAFVCDVDWGEIAWRLPPPGRRLPRPGPAEAAPPPIEAQLAPGICPGAP
jgi:protein TonB